MFYHKYAFSDGVPELLFISYIVISMIASSLSSVFFLVGSIFFRIAGVVLLSLCFYRQNCSAFNAETDFKFRYFLVNAIHLFYFLGY